MTSNKSPAPKLWIAITLPTILPFKRKTLQSIKSSIKYSLDFGCTKYFFKEKFFCFLKEVCHYDLNTFQDE